MRAIVIEEFGGPEKLRPSERPEPSGVHLRAITAQAHRESRTGHVRGKIVLRI